MKRVAWLTDIHLSFVEEEHRQDFVDRLVDCEADAFLLGGDIGEATNVVAFLKNIGDIFQTPTYFVLGNHDFYGGGITSVRNAVAELSLAHPHLNYLTTAEAPNRFSKSVALVGHDGWADGREGDYDRSLVMMNDYRLIQELAPFDKQERLAELHRLGDEAAQHVRDRLDEALQQYLSVFVLTHVPPFREACWYRGKISDDEWAPHFVCQSMGKVILELAEVYPSNAITVLCGHTHSPGECHPAPNVRVITGGAEYGHPQITKIFEVA